MCNTHTHIYIYALKVSKFHLQSLPCKSGPAYVSYAQHCISPKAMDVYNGGKIQISYL